MLYLATKAIVDLLFPIEWTGVLIPVLPARLIQALEAPCPYIVGVERRYDKIELPSDDFVLVDLDKDMIESTFQPTSLPRQHKRKLMSLLQLAAPHHLRYGVPKGPPAYAVESFPFDSFMTENPNVFISKPPSTHLAKYVGLNSNAFGQTSIPPGSYPPLIFNAFLHARNEPPHSARSIPSRGRGDRQGTISAAGLYAGSPSRDASPLSSQRRNHPLMPITRQDSGGLALQASLREKRSTHFDAVSRRSSMAGMDVMPGVPRRPSAPLLGHASNVSLATLNGDNSSSSNKNNHSPSTYAPSVYAQSTVAASTIAPQALVNPVRNSDGIYWAEGHCFQLHACDERTICAFCDEQRAEEPMYRCSACKTVVHGRCAPMVCLVCPDAFHPDQIRAAFVRFFASLFYTYRKFLQPAPPEKQKIGQLYKFNVEAFMRSLPSEHAEYISVLQQTQGKSIT